MSTRAGTKDLVSRPVDILAVQRVLIAGVVSLFPDGRRGLRKEWAQPISKTFRLRSPLPAARAFWLLLDP